MKFSEPDIFFFVPDLGETLFADISERDGKTYGGAVLKDMKQGFTSVLAICLRKSRRVENTGAYFPGNTDNA